MAIYEALGMDLSAAFRMFMQRIRMARGLPFPAVLPENCLTKAETRAAAESMRKETEDASEMAPEETNAEIRAAGAEREPNH